MLCRNQRKRFLRDASEIILQDKRYQPTRRQLKLYRCIKAYFFSVERLVKNFFLFSLNRGGGGDVVAYLTFFKYFFRQTLSTVIQLLNNMSSNLFAVDLVLRNQFLCVVHRRDVLPSDRHISMTNFLRYVY
jgi:hypothetical protein